MKAFVLASLTMLLLQAAFPIAASADTTGSLVGRVRDTAGRPIADAIVTVSSPAQVTHTTTGANGCYSFVGLAPGTYKAVVEKLGFAPVSIPGVVIAAGNQTVVNMSVRPRLVSVSIDRGRMLLPLVQYGQTADVYTIRAWNNPLFANAQNVGQLLQFVPGVQVGAGGFAIR